MFLVVFSAWQRCLHPGLPRQLASLVAGLAAARQASDTRMLRALMGLVHPSYAKGFPWGTEAHLVTVGLAHALGVGF